MEITQITDPAMIATILALDDPGLDANMFGTQKCSKVEWVQHLLKMVQADNGNSFRIYGIVEEGRVLGYMSALNCSDPPVYRCFVIEYQTFLGIEDINERKSLALQALNKIQDWARGNGCCQIAVCAKNETVARSYSIFAGFKRTEDITLMLEF
jgi:L-amino acid N-acyltransferase YncA